jgi:hypothetical protein
MEGRRRLLCNQAKTTLVICIVLLAIPLCCQDVAESHIDANVPEPKDFDRFLLRDLRGKFCRTDKCKVTYELLRKGATQSGIAYPKFYAWIEVSDGPKQQRGAVRLAAINKDHFEITNYLPAERIRNAPEEVSAIFPAPLVKGIIDRAGKTKPQTELRVAPTAL